MSPRRSSRARATQPLGATTTNSSSSSLSSGRERNTRSSQQQNKLSSPQRTNPRSQSLEELDDKLLPPPRRTRSGHEDIKEPALAAADDDDPEDDDDEEGDVTRCVCGQLEYPGLPAPLQEQLRPRTKPSGTATPDESADDVSGIFIQCDICKVWQHGGCVGILDAEAAPDEYFCEQCRKDLHSVTTTATGQMFSRYKPATEDASPPHSPPPTRETRKSRENKPRASAEALMAKRRPTMNSYDEQEQLRRAIEESKKEGLLESAKRGKRSHDGDEENESPSKRPRTGSNASLTEAALTQAVSSSDEALIDMKADIQRTTRTREKEQKERERERQEATLKRKSRIERRRGGEDSDAADEPVPPPSTQSSPPDVNSPPLRSQKKPPLAKGSLAAALHANKGRRGGPRNGRDALGPSALARAFELHNDDAMMRTRSRSRSRAPESSPPATNGHHHGPGPTSAAVGPTTISLNGHALANGLDTRPSRPKHMNPNRTSLNEMKKRVAGILEFVNKAQEEVGRERDTGLAEDADGAPAGAPCNGDANGDTNGSIHGGANGHANGHGNGHSQRSSRAVSHVNGESSAGRDTADMDGAEFAALSAAGMLRVLRARLTGWEQEFGRWGRAA